MDAETIKAIFYGSGLWTEQVANHLTEPSLKALTFPLLADLMLYVVACFNNFTSSAYIGVSSIVQI